MLLSPILASLVAVTVVLFLRYRVRHRSQRAPLFKSLFVLATIVLAIHAVSATVTFASSATGSLIGDSLGPIAMIMAMLAFIVVNTGLVFGAVVLSSDQTIRGVVGRGDEIVMETATLCVGGLVALAITIQPWMVIFALPPLLVLHRAILVKHLQKAAVTDGKTGLLTAGAWHDAAEAQLKVAQERGGSAAVLVLDLDHFKRVNDRYGHLAGDRVLRSVADVLQHEVRGADLVGRFGGEEFVMMFPRPDSDCYRHAELAPVADRIRRRVRDLSVEISTPDGPLTISDLSTSIGGAVFPGDAGKLLDLIAVADAALYAAKRAGRDTVRLGRTETVDESPMVELS